MTFPLECSIDISNSASPKLNSTRSPLNRFPLQPVATLSFQFAQARNLRVTMIFSSWIPYVQCQEPIRLFLPTHPKYDLTPHPATVLAGAAIISHLIYRETFLVGLPTSIPHIRSTAAGVILY